MSAPESAKVNAQGHLEIGGCDLVQLAQEFGTPLYVMDEVTLRNTAKRYRETFTQLSPENRVIFATKSLSVLGILNIMKEEGLGADVVSGGELYAALKAGIAPKDICFHGNNKSRDELEMALLQGVGQIVVDNQTELEMLANLSAKIKKEVCILLRIIPGIEAHTHEFIQTGQLDSKFGIPREQLGSCLTFIKGAPFLKLIGIHAHIGSQILEIPPFVKAVEILLGLAKEMYAQEKIVLQEINFGGGLGIEYEPSQKPPELEMLGNEIRVLLDKLKQGLPFPMPRLVVEPGRSIVGQAGVTLYTVGSIKELPGIRKYVAIDGGMSDNPRPITYQARYEAIVANKANAPRTETVTLAGKHCESGDILIKDIALPPLATGDLIAVLCTGAYNHAMASNYNRMCRPAMVLVKNGKARLLVRRETYEDLISHEIL